MEKIVAVGKNVDYRSKKSWVVRWPFLLKKGNTGSVTYCASDALNEKMIKIVRGHARMQTIAVIGGQVVAYLFFSSFMERNNDAVHAGVAMFYFVGMFLYYKVKNDRWRKQLNKLLDGGKTIVKNKRDTTYRVELV